MVLVYNNFIIISEVIERYGTNFFDERDLKIIITPKDIKI